MRKIPTRSGSSRTDKLNRNPGASVNFAKSSGTTMSPELRNEATSDLSWLLILEGVTLMVETGNCLHRGLSNTSRYKRSQKRNQNQAHTGKFMLHVLSFTHSRSRSTRIRSRPTWYQCYSGRSQSLAFGCDQSDQRRGPALAW